jgi:hypothetical protein
MNCFNEDAIFFIKTQLMERKWYEIRDLFVGDNNVVQVMMSCFELCVVFRSLGSLTLRLSNGLCIVFLGASLCLLVVNLG